MKYSVKLIDEFINKSRYKNYSDIAEKQLKSGPNALMKQRGWNESEYLNYNIKTCVMAYSRDKDKLIGMFKDFVDFLNNEGIHAIRHCQHIYTPRLFFIYDYSIKYNYVILCF